MGMLRAAIVTLIMTFFFTVIGNAVAEEVTPEKLADVEEQLKATQQQNEETKQEIVQLEKKVQCTYKLVKGYENCDKSFSDKNADYVACIEKARKEKDDCLQEIAENSD
jgi:cell division protein FtsL